MQRATMLLWRVVLAGVLLAAAWGKARAGVNQTPFPETIYDRVVQGHAWVHWALLGVEVLLGLWLLLGWRRRAALVVTLVVLLGMSGLLVREIVSPDPMGCGCGLQPVMPGRGPEVVRRELLLSLARNALLMVGAVYLLLAERGEPRGATSAPPPSGNGG
jgi:uncharacterized membrane protein YphA (DoxX/SURF4 family)